MYLKSLTLKGFKSFASATTLAFEPGITAIVGPNGSGKSNIVDALAWVMGEQGAKHLRGGKMDDVIFAGTAGRSPLGRAEVTLTIDNTDGVLPIDYTEVTISRTLFRAGGSEYAINGHTARLLDVQELLSDTGMGREMHVIVGQGQLDQILQATPELRRGFIEEAAGVLKHRRRKEKASRKLESTRQNLDRLSDLIGEIRRQLKPLGRQAAVARKAAVVQAELRDARSRLLADDLTAAQLSLQSERENHADQEKLRAAAQARLEQARAAEQQAQAELAAASPALSAAQEQWYVAIALKERMATIESISAERMRHSDEIPASSPGRDPDQLEAEAAEVRRQETALNDEIAAAQTALDQATAQREQAEQFFDEAEKDYAAQLRAVADRRAGVARLSGQISSLTSRLDASAEEVSGLTGRRDDALARADAAEKDYLALENQITGLGDGESGLDAGYEVAEAELRVTQAARDELDEARVRVERESASLSSRIEALQLGLERKDGAAALAERKEPGILGPLSQLMSVEPGWETAVAAALGTAAEALTVVDATTARRGLDILDSDELGNASLVINAAPQPEHDPRPLPSDVQPLLALIHDSAELAGALARLLPDHVAVEDLAAADDVIRRHPQLIAVTRRGEILSQWIAIGGSGAGQSRIELQAAISAAQGQLDQARHELERLRFEREKAQQQVVEAQKKADAALALLNESDATMSALTEQISTAGQASVAARAEVERADAAIQKAAARRAADEQELAALRQRLDLAGGEQEIPEPDPEHRDELSVRARMARQTEMDARLALRTAQERARSLAGRADSLSRAAARERASRAEAAARQERARREARVAAAVHLAAEWLGDRVARLVTDAQAARDRAEQIRARADQAIAAAREEVRQRSAEVESLVEGAHREEMARIEQQMRLEQLAEKAMNELGLDADTLMSDFGPDQLVPILTRPDGTALTDDDDQPEPVPFDRAQQLKREKNARRTLEQLGRINPLALEEFDALNERHQFLAEQLDDLKKTRKDLEDIIDEVDARVQEVFTQAYADIESTFAVVFPRLFPGGEGRLVLTDPQDMLTTGVDIEARPAGKKVKRMSLLSGGERSLVAVAFLFSLFIARPSPFYILDEVEAALDDVNLTRLLGIYEELGKDSQLLVITHQKRTMEKADALYGVTMRGDGVTKVISQRLVD